MTHTYKNPWYDPTRKGSTPTFSTEARPLAYRGYQIFRVHDGRFDVVRDGVCVTQRAGPQGARRAVDEILDNSEGL